MSNLDTTSKKSEFIHLFTYNADLLFYNYYQYLKILTQKDQKFDLLSHNCDFNKSEF